MSPAIDISARSLNTDASPVVAFQAMREKLERRRPHSWWVVSREYCSDPYSSPATPLDDVMVSHRSDDENDDRLDFVIENATAKCFAMS